MKHDGYGPYPGERARAAPFTSWHRLDQALTWTMASATSTRCTPVHDHEVQLYAFDVLALDGDELRDLPLYLCKTRQIYTIQTGHGSITAPVHVEKPARPVRHATRQTSPIQTTLPQCRWVLGRISARRELT